MDLHGEGEDRAVGVKLSLLEDDLHHHQDPALILAPEAVADQMMLWPLPHQASLQREVLL